MPSTTPLRRSNRTRKPTNKALAATTPKARVEKHQSTQLTPLAKTRKLKSLTIKPSITQAHILHAILNNESSSSPTDSDSKDSGSNIPFENSCPSSPECQEHTTLSSDNVVFRAADPIGRRDSYDSRHEPGNEAYQLDDFIVGDSSEDDISVAGSEITILQESSDESHSDSDSSETVTQTQTQRRSIPGTISRQVSNVSIASSSSALFVSDSSAPESPLSRGFWTVPADFGPADIVEEIYDAVVRFSRRCNRYLKPLRLELEGEMFADEEVAEAVERGVEQGLGRVEVGVEGKVRVTIGPAV